MTYRSATLEDRQARDGKAHSEYSEVVAHTGTGTFGISGDKSESILTVTGATDCAFSLGDAPIGGFRKTIHLRTKGGAGNAVITPSNLNDGTTITLNEEDQTAELIFVDGAWSVLELTDGSLGAGAVAVVTGLAAAETKKGDLHKTVLAFTDVDIALIDEAGTVAYGGLKVYDFPEGHIMVMGAVADLTVGKDAAGVDDDANGDFGVGTATAGNDATLSGTEEDVIPTTEMPIMSSGATTAKGASTSTEAASIFDGSATAKDLYVNFLIDDDDHDVDGTPTNLVIGGTLTVWWMNLGDT